MYAAAHREQIATERVAALMRAQAERLALGEAERLAERAERLRAKARGLRLTDSAPQPRSYDGPDHWAEAAQADREAAAVERAAVERALAVCSNWIEPL
jgi:hypothetical protein